MTMSGMMIVTFVAGFISGAAWFALFHWVWVMGY